MWRLRFLVSSVASHLPPCERRDRFAPSRLLDLDFDHLLFAHGDPLIGGGKTALREFLDR